MPGPAGRAAVIERSAFIALAAAAVIAAVVIRAYPDYDTYYALVWGRELVHGQLPSYTAFAAATPHPLFNVVAAAVGLVGGSDADRWMVGLCALAHVALAWGVYRLGSAIANWAIGAIAAALIGASPLLLEFTSRGHVDIPFLALVVWAAALTVERPASPRVPMILLAIAGLLRPEAWVLAGLLWLWHAARARDPMPGLLAGALAAPALWILTDLAVTGDPLFSLHATHEVSQTLDRPRGLGAVAARYLPSLGVLIPPLGVVAGIAGGVLAWLWRERLRGLTVLAALIASGTATFALFGAAGLPVLPRYLTVPAVGISVLAGLFVAGWTLLPGLSDRAAAATVVIIALAAGGIVFASLRSERASDVADEMRYFAGVHDDLVAILDTPAVVTARRCGPISIPAYLQLPDVRWRLDADRDEVVSRADSSERRRWARGVALVALGTNAAAIGEAPGLPRRANAAPAGFTEVARNDTFAAYARCA